MKNTIVVNGNTLTIANKERPFGNNFTQISAKNTQYEGVDEIQAYVLCTDDTNEPGREYSCYYSTTGKLNACCTVN